VHRVEVMAELLETHVPGHRVAVYWNGPYGETAADNPLLPLAEDLFPGQLPRGGKGVGAKGVTKGGGGAAGRTGKGEGGKGEGPKGGSIERVSLQVAVPPCFGLRTFAIQSVDAAGNVTPDAAATVNVVVSARPPAPGAAEFVSYSGGVVTIKSADRMR